MNIHFREADLRQFLRLVEDLLNMSGSTLRLETI